jgi:DNA-binding CsgD family transcriptional regulator
MIEQTPTTISAAHVAALLRLVNRLHGAAFAGPVERKQRLLTGLGKLVNADAAACAVFARPARSRRGHVNGATFLSRSYRGPSGTELVLTNTLIAALDDGSPPSDGATVAAAASLVSVVPLGRRGAMAALALARSPRGARATPFTRDDHLLVDLAHRELKWVYAPDLPLASPDVRALPPRPRQTLQYLLDGCSEKQIAVALGLSVNTVHHYVKHLYRHFGVSSRSQLLARWVRA